MTRTMMMGWFFVLWSSVGVVVAATATAIPPPKRVEGTVLVVGIDVADATTYEEVFVSALAALAGVDRARAAIANITNITTIAATAAGVDVAFTMSPPPGGAAKVADTINSKTPGDVDDAISGAAAETGSAHTVSVFNFVQAMGISARVAAIADAAACDAARTKDACWGDYDCQWCDDAQVCVSGNETCPNDEAGACSTYSAADCFRHMQDCHWCSDVGLGVCVVSSQPCP